MLNAEKIKVIAFDLFGTIFDLKQVPREEVVAYGNHIRNPVWSPLKLPKHWENMPAFSDSANGIKLLREKFIVVTCSNAPIGLQARMSKNAGIEWDCYIPLELNKVFKTNHKAYLTICEVLDCVPEDVLMVTANKSFGDLEASVEVGMQSFLVRSKDSPSYDVEGLANLLCEGTK